MSDEYDEINPVPGLKTDLELLLSQFTNSKSVRYTEFAKIWCQMGFPTIFCGWAKDEALREMVETAFKLIVGYWNEIYTFQVRMGGLYLMYAFYFCQPLDPPQKVRLTQSQWVAGRKLLATIEDQKHLDAAYVYHKLHFYKAFYFVMAPQQYQIAPTRRSTRDDLTKKEYDPEPSQPRSTSVHNVFPAALVNNMESLHAHYREMKNKFISAENLKETEGLHTLKEDFYDVLKNGLKHMESWRPGSVSFDPDEVTKAASAVVPSSPGQQGANRRRLKEHAFERSGVMSRHQRHLVVESSDSEKTFVSPKKRPARRKKRKTDDVGNVSSEDVANASMPLDFDDESSANSLDDTEEVDDGPAAIAAQDDHRTQSTSSGDDDVLMKAMMDQFCPPGSAPRDSDSAVTPNETSKSKAKKGKGKVKGSSKSHPA